MEREPTAAILWLTSLVLREDGSTRRSWAKVVEMPPVEMIPQLSVNGAIVFMCVTRIAVTRIAVWRIKF